MADGNIAAMRKAPAAVKEGVYTGAYGNRFAVVNVNLGGYRFVIHADQSGFRPHIKVMDQKEVLNRVMDELVDCINKGAAALAAPARNCDRFDDELDAQLEFLNEVWLISVDRDTMLERDRIDNWTREMCLGYAKWLMAKAEGSAE